MSKAKQNILTWFDQTVDLGPSDQEPTDDTKKAYEEYGTWLREYLDSIPEITKSDFHTIWAKWLEYFSSGDVGVDWEWFESTWLGVYLDKMDKIQDFYNGSPFEEEIEVVEMDPKKPNYWVNQKVTLPKVPIYEDYTGGDENIISREDYKKIKALEGKKIIIHSVRVDCDGTAWHAYYNLITPGGIMINLSFIKFPIEMAREFGFSGWDHFGKKLPLKP